MASNLKYLIVITFLALVFSCKDEQPKKQMETSKKAGAYYTEDYRPQFHFFAGG
jgi:hypothetical protein